MPQATNLDEYVNQIRLSVENREKTWVTETAAMLIDLVRRGDTVQLMVDGSQILDDFDRTALKLSLTSPSFDVSRSQYGLHELLKYDDQEFIWNAYRALLKREPDEIGFKGYLDRLRSGLRTKIDIVASIRYSVEGRRNNVRVNGLLSKALVSKAARLLKWRR